MEALRTDNEQLRQLLEESGEAGRTASEAMPSTPELTGLARRQVLRDVTEIMNAVGLRSQPAIILNPSSGPARPAGALPAYQLSSTGKLPPRFGELFGLDDAAVARLHDRLDSLTTQINTAIEANSWIEQAGPEVVVVHVSSLGPQSEAYRQEFLAAFRESLGEDGLRALKLLNQESDAIGFLLARDQEALAAGETVPPRGQISTLFRAFGGYDRTITITRNNGRYTYLEEGDYIRASGSNNDRAALVDRLGAAAGRLPADF